MNASGSTDTSRQDVMDSNFEFYQAWNSNNFEEYELCYKSRRNSNCDCHSISRSLFVSVHDCTTGESDCLASKLNELFSAFGPVANVEPPTEAHTNENEFTVTFEDGSDGARKAIASQPIKMFGSVLNIRLADAHCKQTSAAFPIMVASPENGAWYKKPSEKSFLKQRHASSTPTKVGTMGKLAAAASKLMADSFNPLSDELSSPESAQNKRESISHQRLPSASLHSLLSPTIGDPLFDDDTDVMGYFDGSMNLELAPPQSEVQTVKHFHCDNTLHSWVWAGNKADKGSSCSDDINKAETHLSNTLELGRASNASLPLLSLTTRPMANGDQKCAMEDTNLHLLHKQTLVTVTNEKTGQQVGSYTLYQARHPCLAPLISVTRCTNNTAHSASVEAFVSVFDITPSSHRPLHELLRTGDFLTKPLYPGMEGHVNKTKVRRTSAIELQQTPGTNTSQSRIKAGGNNDQGLCRCRTIFDRGRSELNFTQQNTNFRAELRQFRSSTSTMFSLLAEQEIFDDLRKLHLLPHSPSHHPQVYSHFNQTVMMHRVGLSYYADVVDLRIRFLALQLFHAVNFFHSKGLTLGDQLRPERIYVDREGWIRFVVPIVPHHTYGNLKVGNELNQNQRMPPKSTNASDNELKDRRIIFNRYNGERNKSNDISTTIIPYPGYGLLPFAQWQNGLITNLAYLMMINAAAGRTPGDQINPPILPWVTDFTSMIELLEETPKEDVLRSPWRDLTKTKYRLHKGDEQLNQSYMHASPAHHIPETISDLTYTVYRARCLPLSELKAKVRNRFIPEHYPRSMERLFAWTPDEATLEFYAHSRPSIFTSKHQGLSDLCLPRWCNNVGDFISYHRGLLESQFVGERLHSWIDLTFGIGLVGERAVLEKNVVLHCASWNPVQLDDKSQCNGNCDASISEKNSSEGSFNDDSQRSMFVQLFLRPHPKRATCNASCPMQIPTTGDNIDKTSVTLNERKQHDLSMIGAIIQECYSSARVVPESGVQSAIQNLLVGRLDVKTTLQNLDEPVQMNDVHFPFPSGARQAYDFLSSVQNDSFTRNQSDSVCDSSDFTSRSTNLEKLWKTVKSTRISNMCSDASIALLLPTFLAPFKAVSVSSFLENCNSSLAYTSSLGKLRDYILQLSASIPVELLLPTLLQFFSEVLKYTYDDNVFTEAIGRLMLDHELISALYKRSTWLVYIKCISRFISSKFRTTKDLSRENGQLRMNSIVGYFISSLGRDEALGVSICCRYIIPILIDHIEGGTSLGRSDLAIKSLRSIVPFLEEDVIGIIIVKPVMKIIWRRISLRNITDVSNSWSSYAAAIKNFPVDLLDDLISLLNLCMSQMESNIERYYIRATPLCIPQLLLYLFKAIISSADDVDGCYQEIFKGTCMLVRSMVSNAKVDTKQLNDHLLPTIEALCSEINDEYVDLSMKLRSECKEEKSIDRIDTFLFPGITDACLLAREAMNVYGKHVIRQKCPSALELIAWIDFVERKRENVDNNEEIAPDDDLDKLSRQPFNNDNDVKDEHQSRHLEDIQISGDDSIEMLPPRLSSADDADVNDDENDLGISTMAEQDNTELKSLQYDLSKQKRDLSWVMGVHRLPDRDLINYLWQPRMMATTSLIPPDSSSEGQKGTITTMCVNKSESLLVVGNSLGEVMVFDLRRHPPSPTYRKRVSSNDIMPILQVSFLNGIDVLVCDGGLHLWDVEGGVVRSSISSNNTFLCLPGRRSRPWKNADFIAFSAFPALTSSDEILRAGCGQVATISSSHLCIIDICCSSAEMQQQVDSTEQMNRKQQPNSMLIHLKWYISSASSSYHKQQHKERESISHSSFKLNSVATHSEWVCVGSSSGHIHCFDRRCQSKLLCCWKAHNRSIEYLQSVSGNVLLSVSADKTAVLWNLALSPPRQMGSIYNIPGKEGKMNIATYNFDKNGVVSIPGNGHLLLCAVTGRKAVFQSMPIGSQSDDLESPDVKAMRIVMSDYEGNHISSSDKFDIRSIALLPLRQLVLLGCEEEIHVCL